MSMRGSSQSEPEAILRQHGIRPRHRLGQNFLHDPDYLQRIVDATEISDNDAVLEIGCGLGSLTRQLARIARRVVAVEIDPKLAAVAQETVGALPNVRIVAGDILKLSPASLDMPAGYVIAANIPYYITSPILRHVLEAEPKPRRMVLTVQKEVAARICATPPDMNLLAVGVQIYGSPRVVAAIPAEAFYPVPKVDSAVVRVECYDQPGVPATSLNAYFRIVKAGFSQPRKMLSNSLAAGLGRSTSETRRLIGEAGIDPRRRAETLALEDWARLAEVVS